MNGVVGLRAEAASFHPNEGVAARSSVILVVPRAELLAGSCLQAPRSHSVAVYEVVGIRAEAASLHPTEGVAGKSSVILVVPRADRGARDRPVPLVAAGSQPALLIALSVSMLSRSNTPIFGRP